MAGKRRGVPTACVERFTIAMTTRELYQFMTLLAKDDNFREKLETDPRETLAAYHIYITPAQVPRRVKLPTKEEVERTLDETGFPIGFPVEEIDFRVFVTFSHFSFLNK